MTVLRACTRCGRLSDGTRCPEHRRDLRPNAAARGYGSAWARTSVNILTVRVWCEEPGCNERATEVHHLDGEGPLGPRGHDPTNLLALCKRCHSRRTALEHSLGGPR